MVFYMATRSNEIKLKTRKTDPFIDYTIYRIFLWKFHTIKQNTNKHSEKQWEKLK